jgi:DNA-binding XRE family transcriptional regulator
LKTEKTHTIGEKIKDLRKSQGITQQGLAESAGCTRETIKTIEKGTRNPSWRLVINIMNRLGFELKFIQRG